MIEYVTIPLGYLLSLDISEEKLNEAFKKFSCNLEEDLESFLVNKAIVYEKTEFGRTFLLLDKNKLNKDVFEILAFYTIGQTTMDIAELNSKQHKKILGSYPGRDRLTNVPAYLIGQIGRSDKCSHDELSGDTILNECYSTIKSANQIAGGRMIILECREKMFDKFYGNRGFHKMNKSLNERNLFTLYKKIEFNKY